MFVSIILKQYKPEFSIIVYVATGIILFCLIADVFKEILNDLFLLSYNFGLNQNILGLLIKIIGIGYLIEFSVDICNDSGCQSIANKINLAGKIIILGLVVPILKEIFEYIINLL